MSRDNAYYQFYKNAPYAMTAKFELMLKCRSTGRPELESQLGVVTGQYRRLLSSCIVRAQAQCLISRIGVISPEARVAAQRREVAGRLERELREERQAQWMASLRGPGWARRGRCHGFQSFMSNCEKLCLDFRFSIQTKNSFQY